MAGIPVKDLPQNIQLLVNQRQASRQSQDFQAADHLRQQLMALGYQVQDGPAGPEINLLAPNPDPLVSPTLSLFGSGEISSVGRQVHELALTRLGKSPVRIAIISTPAGFQPNVKVVYGEIAAFFKKSLANFHPQIKVVYANNWEDGNNPQIIEPVSTADYIFTGPGSPTYAVKHLKDTLLLKTILDRVQAKKASLSLASAAAIAFSQYCLPVYEIYKVGEPLHWQTGLLGLNALYQPLTIIPHFNNQEGGIKTDTSHCYMGKKRYEELLSLLPPQTPLWGIDELTGVVIDLATHETQIIGKGSLYHLTP